MGCDIHILTEYKGHIGGSEKWINCDNWRINKYNGEENEPEYTLKPIYDGRNYSLFSILADVRNYGHNECISEPKGIPKDLHFMTQKYIEQWREDGHSHSYYTLKELIDARKKFKKTKFSGMVTPEGKQKILNGEMPDSYCQWTNIPNYEQMQWEHETDELEAIIVPLIERMKDEFWIWREPTQEDYDNFADKIRVVFFFDN